MKKKKKFSSPLKAEQRIDKSMSGEDFNIESEMSKAKESLGFVGNVMSLDPKDISDWEFRDRGEFEVGDLDSLADSIKLKGQAQPIIVVLSDASFKSKDGASNKYIVIAGYRRWLACFKHALKIDAVIKKLTFEDAIGLLEAENEKESVSDYSKGMFYSSIINSERIKKDDLRKRLGLKPAHFSNLLAFESIPKDIWSLVPDVTKISSRTASILRSYINKDKEHLQLIKAIANQITGNTGESRIKKLIESAKQETKLSCGKVEYSMVAGKKAYKIDNGVIKVNKKIMSDESLAKFMLKVDEYMKSKIESFMLDE
tara:strand:+ start:1425 stop:2366 length:942 start_codon:yes stop_codon:yes gene_type:complete